MSIRTSVARTSSVSAALMLASLAGAQTAFTEAEPNDNKAAANLVTMACGDTITGNSTGASTTVAGAASADTFRIRTVSTGSITMYTLTMSQASGTLPAHTLTIRGLSQSAGVPGTTDSTVLTAQTVGTTKVARWYGTGPVGSQQDIYVRVGGTAATTENYVLTLTCDSVTPTAIPGTVQNGNITVKPDAATATAIDTDFWVYDGSYNAIVGFGHDDADETGVTRNMSPGTYYIAMGNYNTANNLGSPTDDTFRSGIVMDFPNVLTNSSTGSLTTMNAQVNDASTTNVGTGGRADSWQVAWYSFVVVPPSVPQGTGVANPASAPITGTTLLTVNTLPAANPTSTGITVVADLSAINGSAAQSFSDNGTNGDVTAGDGIYSYLATLSEPLSAGPVTLNFTVADAQSRSSTGTINLTLTAAPQGGCCTAGNCAIATAYNCGQGGGTYRGNGTNCGEAAYTLTPSSSSFSSIAGSGTLLATASGCDDCVQNITLPFSFNFYGADYTTANVSSNGNLQFVGTSTEYFNGVIPSAGLPNGAIYPMWDDYNPGEQGDIYMQEIGSAPNRSLVIEWNNVTQYTAAGTYPATSETFQLVLHETTNQIEFLYGSITPTLTTGAGQGTGVDASGGDRTIGVENLDGTVAASVPSNGFSGGNLLVAFQPAINPCGPVCGTSDFNGDGDFGTDADIEAFFACLAGNCCPTCYAGGSDFNADGDFGTDADIESFFRVLAGGEC